MSARGRGLDAALALGLFALGLGMQLAVVDRGAFYMDEGFVLQTAAEINRGKVMYRDIVIPAPGPVTFYLLAALFRVTGSSFLASRVAIAVVSSALGAVLFLLVRGAVSRPVAVLAGLAFLTTRLWAFPHWLFFHYATLAGFLVGTAYLVVAAAIERASLRLVALGGLVAGVGVFTKQDVGGTGLVGLAAALVLLGGVPRLAGLVALGVGALAAAAPTLAYFASQGALGSLFDQTVRWTFRGFAEFEYLRLPRLLPFFAQDPDLRSRIGEYAPSILVSLYWKEITASALFRSTPVWDAAIKAAFYLPFATLALGGLVVAVAWLRTPATPEAGRQRRRATLVLTYASATLAAFNPPRDWLHLFVLYHPTLLVLALLVERAAGDGGAWRRVVLGVAALAVGGALVLDVRLLRDLRRTFDTPVATAAGTLRLPPEEAGVVNDLLAWIATRTTADDPLPVIPYHPLVQFLADRTAGTRNLIFWPVRSVEATDERLIAELDAANAPVVVYSISQYAHLHRFRVSFAGLFAHLVERYEIVRTFTPPSAWGLVLCALAPRAPAPPPLVDLAAHLDQASVRAEDGRVLAGEERAAVAGRTLWPFRRVVYQRPGRARPTTIAIPVDVPPGARLRFGYGLNPDEWVTFTPAAVTFSVSARVDDQPIGTLFTATADPQHRPQDRVWKDVGIDLRQLAGRHVVLELQTATESPNGLTADLAGWADLALVGDAPQGAAPR